MTTQKRDIISAICLICLIAFATAYLGSTDATSRNLVYADSSSGNNEEACKDAKDNLKGALEAAAIACTAALIEPTPFGEVICLYFMHKINYYLGLIALYC